MAYAYARKRRRAAKIYTSATVQNAEFAHSTQIFTVVAQKSWCRKSRHTTKITIITVIVNTCLSYSL